MMTVSRWYELDPETVFGWPMPHYTDRLEYMHIINELNKPDKKSDNGMEPLKTGEVEYKGKKKDV